MTPELPRFRNIFFSREARAEEYGARLAEIFQSAGVPFRQLPGDNDVLCHHKAFAPGNLLVLRVPEENWISVAEHGTLAVRRGERYLHPIVGCRSACAYCYLRGRPAGRQPLRLYVALEHLCRTLDAHLGASQLKSLLFCTGELGDSLADADLYPVGAALAKYFSARCDARLELRTKSDRVESLLPVEHRCRTTVAFSLSPESSIASYEPGTASLGSRLCAARRCQEAGYPVALKFDPLICDFGWRAMYEGVVETILAHLDVALLEHLSIGCLRWSPRLAVTRGFRRDFGRLVQGGTWIEYRPNKRHGTALREERLAAYRWLRQLFRRKGLTAPIEWSMEEPEVIRALGGVLNHD